MLYLFITKTSFRPSKQKIYKCNKYTNYKNEVNSKERKQIIDDITYNLFFFNYAS